MQSRDDKLSDGTNNGVQDFLTGQLLIAMPGMGDPRFEKAVILICGHDEKHAMGVIVNKRMSDIQLVELLEQLAIEPSHQAAETPVFFGGPVQTERGVVLHSSDYWRETTMEVAPGIGLTATTEILVDIAGTGAKTAPPREYLLAIGHAGWGPGQLEDELSMNAWAHCDCESELVFGGAENAAWKQALAKLGVTGAMLSPEWAAIRDEDQPLN